MKKTIKIKCWVSLSEDDEFDVCSTRKLARQKAEEAKEFDVEMKVYKATLFIKK